MLQRREPLFLVVVGLLPFAVAACHDATASIDPRTQTPLVRVATVATSVQTERSFTDRKSTRLNSSHTMTSRMPSSA